MLGVFGASVSAASFGLSTSGLSTSALDTGVNGEPGFETGEDLRFGEDLQFGEEYGDSGERCVCPRCLAGATSSPAIFRNFFAGGVIKAFRNDSLPSSGSGALCAILLAERFKRFDTCLFADCIVFFCEGLLLTTSAL